MRDLPRARYAGRSQRRLLPAAGGVREGCRASGRTRAGTVPWRLLDEQDVASAKSGNDAGELFDKLPCKIGPQLYHRAYPDNKTHYNIRVTSPMRLVVAFDHASPAAGDMAIVR